MITRLAQRFGFQPSVPVSVVDDWLMPDGADTTALAPRGGTATALVDRYGRLQPVGRSWTLDWTLAAGARWVAALESERVKQQLIAPATLETVVTTPAGEVVQRIAAAVVDGQPVAVIEIENKGGVAIAAGIAARPLVHGGRGYLAEARVGPSVIDLGGQGAVRFDQAASTLVADGIDLLGHMPQPDAGRSEATIRSRSGGAQAAAVFPIPHTATIRMIVELGETVRSSAAVPSIDDVGRGWTRHLEAGMGVAVGDAPLDERLAVAGRGLLTAWPTPDQTPSMITALAELGFAADAPRLFDDLDRIDDDHALLASLARWAQLGDPHRQLDTLDRIIGPVARVAHEAARASQVRGPSWLAWALGALGQRLDAIEQPDVADRVRSLRVDPTAVAPASVDDLLKKRTRLTALAEPSAAARLVLGARGALVADRADGVDLLPALPEAWRGRTIDVLRAPVEGGTVSFGLRWHGPRPALLWEVDREGAPFTVTAASIDAEFSSTDPTGETLLADPGWPRE